MSPAPVLTSCARFLLQLLVYLMSRVPQVRTFLNLLPPSEGDAERFDAAQSLEVCSLFPSVYLPRLT
jgi:hypothetical protein